MNFTIASLIISVLTSIPIQAVATVDECKIGIVDFNKKYSGQFDVSVIKHKEGSVSMFARSSKQAGTRAQADFNGVARTCMEAGFEHGIYMGTLGSNVTTQSCVIVDYRTGGADCNKLSKPLTLTPTRVEDKIK